MKPNIFAQSALCIVSCGLTMKYRPDYPNQFGSLVDARAWLSRRKLRGMTNLMVHPDYRRRGIGQALNTVTYRVGSQAVGVPSQNEPEQHDFVALIFPCRAPGRCQPF